MHLNFHKTQKKKKGCQKGSQKKEMRIA